MIGALPLQAQTESESRWQFSLGVGAGVRTNPLQYSDDIPLVLLPQLSYAGDKFFIDNLDIGFHLLDQEKSQLNLLVTPSYDQIFFERWSSGNFFVDSTIEFSSSDSPKLEVSHGRDAPDKTGNNFNRKDYDLHDRDMTALGGFEYNLQLAQINLQLQWLHDVLDVHDGQEVRLSFGHEWQFNRHTVNLAAGWVWQNAKTLNYFYGVTPAEVAAQDVYQPDADLSPMLRLDWTYRLTENWDLRFFGSYRQLGNEIQKSPVIRESEIVTLFVGGVYHF